MNETIKIWIDLSASDLRTSRLLYDNRHFRTSFFFFQQATEKANKAFALLSGKINEEEFKKIQHDQLKIYRKLIVKQESELKSLIHILKPYPKTSSNNILQGNNLNNFVKSLTDGLNFIDSLRNFDLVKISTKDINSLLSELYKLRETKLKLPKDSEQLFKEQLFRIVDWTNQFECNEFNNICLKNVFDNKEQTKQVIGLLKNKILPMILETIFAYMTLFFCAIITVQHSSLTRYPDKGKNPETLYNKRLPIVNKQVLFMDLLEDSIKILNRLNSY